MTPWKFGLGAHRDLDGNRVATEALDDRLDCGKEIGADPVHLVDEANPGHPVLVGLTPHRLGLGFDAGHGVENGDGTVEHTQRSLHLDGEVDVARGVDDVDHVVVPMCGRRGRGDGDAALLFLLHPVHHGRALMDLTHLVGAARVIEDPLGGRGLPSVNVGHDPDVADFLEGDGACHLDCYQR